MILYPEPFSRWLFRSQLRERDGWYARELDAAHERISRKGEACGPGETEGTSAIVPWRETDAAYLLALRNEIDNQFKRAESRLLRDTLGLRNIMVLIIAQETCKHDGFSHSRNLPCPSTERPYENLTLAQAKALARSGVRS